MSVRRVLVTGSSRGVGRAIALRLARDGFAVTVHCRQGRSEAEQVAGEIEAAGGVADLLQFDVSDREAARRWRPSSRPRAPITASSATPGLPATTRFLR